MKLLFLSPFILLHLHTLAQDNPVFSKEDSVCIRKANAIINQVKKEGADARYFYDDNWLVYLSPSTAGSNPNTLRLVNIGGAKKPTISITAIKIESVNDAGEKKIVEIREPMVIMKDASIARCASAAIDLNNTKIFNKAGGNILFIQLSIQFDGKMSVVTFGKKEN